MLNRRPDHLKYIMLHAENLNVAHLLSFLGYWETFGYKKPTKYASYIRFELVSKTDTDPSQSGFFIKFSYDDEILKFPWCDNKRDCPID